MAIDSDLIRGHVDTIILKTLASGDKYGYEIIKEIETRSNGTYELKQPTLYSCLKRLEGQGFISAYWVNSDIGGKRHYYKLTDLGRQEYDNNMREWLSSRSIIDNLIAENADDVLPEVTTNFIPLTGTENITFRKKTDEEKELDQEQCTSASSEQNQYDLRIEQTNIISTQIENSEQGIQSTKVVNPFAEFYGIEENEGLDFGTDEQDLKLVEEYYNTDENQFDIFNSIEKALQYDDNPIPEQILTSPLSDNQESEELRNIFSNNVKDEATPVNDIQSEQTESQNELDDIVIKNNDVKYSTKFNFKDYKLNNNTYFDNVKDEVGGSGFYEETFSQEQPKEQTLDTSLFDNIINSDDSDDDLEFDSSEDLEEELDDAPFYSVAEENDDEFEISRNYSDLTSDLISEEQNEDYEDPSNLEQDEPENDFNSTKLNFGYSEDQDDESSELIFGAEEDNSGQGEPLPFVRFNYGNYNNFNNNDDDDENNEDAEDEIENYKAQNFTLRNEDELTSSYSYDYDRDEEFSNARELALRDEYLSPSEDPRNEVSIIDNNSDESLTQSNFVYAEPEIQNYDPIYNDPDATTNLFVDNKRSFVPQYTDNDSRQLLNTLSSYGSIRFSPSTKANNINQQTITKIDDLRTNFNNAGIEVRVYERRPKETAETKNYILPNKIKMFTSWFSFALTSLLLVIGYLIAGPIGYTDLRYVPSALPASFFLFSCLGAMILIPIVFTVIFLLNQTKKVKPRYSAKVAIIFSVLFAVQCLVIIYAVNIPFGLYSFTQIDYNHLLWYLPAICTLYLPIHTLVYTLLFNSKRFHV